MDKQLVPTVVLEKADKVLFIAHLAIGDFSYLQNYFKAFKEQYPHIKMHLWIDEPRRTFLWWKWQSLKSYSLYDWVRATGYFDKIYTETYSPWKLWSSLKKARSVVYPLVISVATLRAHRYALLARLAGPQAFVVGLTRSTKFIQWMKRSLFRLLDAGFSVNPKTLRSEYHITDVYASWFKNMVGVDVDEDGRRPFIMIPRVWAMHAKLTLLKWGVVRGAHRTEKGKPLVFINIFAKDKKRCWTVSAALDVIHQLRMRDDFAHGCFVLNAMPGAFGAMQKVIDEQGIKNIILFSANRHFFQLPALIQLCDLVISVETAVMHLAAALKVPVVAIMRSKNPEWAPWDKNYSTVLFAEKRIDWVKDIPVYRVIAAVDESLKKGQRAAHVNDGSTSWILPVSSRELLHRAQ